MDALPPHIYISETWDTTNSIISAVKNSIKNGILIHIPKYWNQEAKFIFGEFEILESRVECFIKDNNVDMSVSDFMSQLWSEIDRDMQDSFFRFLELWWETYNSCTPIW